MTNDRNGAYTRKGRPGHYISWVDAQGKRKQRKVNVPTVKEALAARTYELARVDKAKYLGFTPPGEETFAEISKRFLAHQRVRLTEKSFERESGIVNKHLGKFFTGQVAKIRRVDIQRYVTKRAGEVSMHSVQKELNVLKHLLRLAVEWEILPINPAQGIKSPRVPAGRVRYLQPTEVRSLLAACAEWLRPIVGLAVSTGMRRSEILNLRWLDIDFAYARILLPQTKNGEGRIVYLNQSALAVLCSIMRAPETKPTSLVFTEITPAQVSVAFARLCRRQELYDFRFHDLRHTTASLMRMAGADIHTVAIQLGHKDVRMAARYQHLSPTFMLDAVAGYDRVLSFQRDQEVTTPEQLPEDTDASD